MKKLITICFIIIAAAGLQASEVDTVLSKYGYNTFKVDYYKVQKAHYPYPAALDQ